MPRMNKGALERLQERIRTADRGWFFAAVADKVAERRQERGLSQREHALESRISIEQAKGIIAERCGLGVDEAFDLIRRAARSHRIKLYDLVGAIRPGEETPPELAAVIAAERRV